jgi:hypothetical protein
MLSFGSCLVFAADRQTPPLPSHKPTSPATSPPSLQPRPPSAPAKEQQHPTTEDKRGTEDVPLAVKILSGPDNQATADEQKRRANEHATAEKSLTDATWKLAWFTLSLVAVALAQVGLFFWQLREIQKSSKAATAAAIAATEQARIMRNSERPFLTIFDPGIPNFPAFVRGDQSISVLEVRADIENVGKGVGFIRAYGIAYEICRRGTQGTKPLDIRSDIGQLVIGGNAKLRQEAALEVIRPPAADEIASIMRGRTSIFFYGYIRYLDIFRVMRRTGFMFEYAPNSSDIDKSCFVMSPNRDWWYDVEEEPEAQSSGA